MRRFITVFLSALLLFALAVQVSGLNTTQQVGSYATVSNDGSCSVTMTVTLRLEQPEEKLKFPLPRDASGITLNGSRVRTQASGDKRLVDLSGAVGAMAGNFSFTVNYTLGDIIHTTETDELELRLPLLSGFAYPVEALDFSVTMPGEAGANPHFSSGYHQANIEKDLTWTVSGAVITGSAKQGLKDHETLVMSLPVTPEMFPQTAITLPDFDAINIAMCVSAVVALLYWLVFLRNIPPHPLAQTTGPEGYSAGELRSILTLQGADLSLMVFSWARLGYVRLQWTRQGRVLIYKQMDMGNERSDFEQRCFRNLFGKRQSVDTAGYRYAAFCQQVAKAVPNMQALVRPHSGNPKLFRGLAALVGLLSGVNLGILLGTGAALQWFLVFVLAILGFVSSLCLQRWAEGLFLRDKEKLWLAVSISAGWLLLSLAAGVASIGLWLIVSQTLAGWMATFGGRRTEAGHQVMAEVLGLRRYLKTVSREQLQHICNNNPEYFYTLAPEAMALGVDKAFAKQFGKMRLPDCPYLINRTEGQMTAVQWSQRLHSMLKAMDARKRQMPLQRLIALLQGFVK